MKRTMSEAEFDKMCEEALLMLQEELPKLEKTVSDITNRLDALLAFYKEDYDENAF